MKLTKHEIREAIALVDGRIGAEAVNETIDRAQVFDFGRSAGAVAELDRDLCVGLWFRGLLRPPFDATIFTFVCTETKTPCALHLVTNYRCTIEDEHGEKLHDMTSVVAVVQRLTDNTAYADSFTWFKPVEDNGQKMLSIGAIDLQHDYAAGDQDYSQPFQNFTQGVAMRVMLLSMMLNTKGVPKRIVPASPALNKKRARSGKPPLSSVTYVDLSRVCAHGHGNGGGGEKAMHLRRGHIRHYDDGSVTWVRDCIVKADGDLKLRERYQLKGHDRDGNRPPAVKVTTTDNTKENSDGDDVQPAPVPVRV